MSDEQGAAREYGRAASRQRLEAVARALTANGIDAEVVDTPAEARERVLGLIPPGASVLNTTSQTLEATGLVEEIERSGRYRALRPQYLAMDRATQGDEIRRLRSAPDVVVGSAHAVTERGEVVIASQTGSQLAPFVYGAARVIWLIGAQKVVRDLDEAMQRIYEYAYPLEDARAREAYGSGSGVNKLLVISREVRAGRITALLIAETIGF
jgi:acyl-CoA hydrolase